MFDDFQDMDGEETGDVFAAAFEPDEPEGLLEPRQSDFFVGHEQNEQAILNLINAGNVPHAMIFAGPKGIGKSTFAFRVARALFKNGTSDSAQDSMFGDMPAELTNLKVASDDPVFSKVASGGHPDLLTIGRAIDVKKGTKKNNLDVETARKVAPFLRMTSSDGGWRVVIVDDADTMNRNAQNAMLKILEEPPSNALLILVCHRLGAMIPTIRSRCRVLNFDALNKEELAALMTREVGNTLSEEDKVILNFLGQGSIGQAQRVISTGGIETANQVLGMLETWPNFNKVDIHHLSDQAGRAGQEGGFENIEAVFKNTFETLTFAKAKGEALVAPLNKDVYNKMLERYSLSDLTEFCDNLNTHFAQAKFANLDKRQAVVGAFTIIAD